MIIQTRKMTAAQKKAQDNFKKAIAYRKKTGCTLKQAFAHVKGGKVSGLDKVIKKGSKTTVLYTKKTKKKAAPKKKASQGVLFGIKKKKAVSKKSVVRNYGSHKDTGSHNVKISVMSGANDLQLIKRYQENLKHIRDTEKIILDYQTTLKNRGNKIDILSKKRIKAILINKKNLLKELKIHAKELKKLL